MNTTIADALEVYKEEVAKFAAWVNLIDYGTGRAKWGTEQWFPWNPRSEPSGWGTRENEMLKVWNAKLKGMEVALGLSFDEIRVVYEAAGLPTAQKALATEDDWHYGVHKILRSQVPVEPNPYRPPESKSVCTAPSRRVKDRSSPPKSEPKPATISGARELTLADKGRALAALLYEGSAPEVNLSNERFSRLLSRELMETGLTSQVLVAEALRGVRNHWNAPIDGDESEQKFRRFLRRVCRDFVVTTYRDLLEVIRDRDNSSDPITV